jgi:hypothetical protein
MLGDLGHVATIDADPDDSGIFDVAVNGFLVTSSRGVALAVAAW